jgi:lipopolysaccharide transport system ATP-binding protein
VSAENAVVVDGAWKKFRLYHDRSSSLKQRFTQLRPARFEEFWAVKNVSLTVPKGSTFGLIGHNGSGKSTLLRLISGIHRVSRGTITTNGRISALLELGAGFHPDLTGRENLFLNGSILGLSRKEIAGKVDDIIEFAGIGDFIEAPVKVYSSGMYVRLGFSIAVNVNPDVLIVDEVIAVGDEEFQRRCMEHLYKLRRSGTTIVLVSHAHGVLRDICDEVAWLDHGELQEVGPAPDVIRSYLERVNEHEAARLSQETEGETVGDAHTRGSGEVRVTALELVDANGCVVPVAHSGDPITLRIHYFASEPIEEPVFGIGVHHELGTHLSGPNTRFAHLHTGTINGPGYIDYHLDRVPLLPGTYRITTAVFDRSVMHPYDVRDEEWTLHVQPGSNAERYGLMELGGAWSAPVADDDTDVRTGPVAPASGRRGPST